ncbi:TetR/AcrR family transcriptional regulator [Streptacidiphilus monticola]|uniref:TetR/AcrR family transcriptional regulator n=1 Tax=Streptacidiphilus monticola TaxID=2161674 RepID=A0ABW1G529_9ACTN
MGKPVKRRYDNTRRQAQVRATRAEVVAAGRQLFVERGYPATTVEAIAEASATPPATVYRLFGSKRGILSAVLDVAFVGDDEPVPFGERPAVRAALGERDPARLLDLFAHLARELLDRSAPVQHVLRTAAVVDPEAAAQLETTNRQRLEGQSRIAGVLADRGALAEDVDQRRAADLIYLLMSPEVHRILTVERGWSPEAYERWLATSLRASLLP